MDFEKEFPARYWINLGRRQERRFETEHQLECAGITAERFPAVDARFVRNHRGYESAGRYALALSQRLVIRRAMLAGAKAVLVLEDDVIFHPELRERLEAMDLPEDWGIFYLGCAHHVRPEPAGEGIVRTAYALDTHAFAVRAPYYRKVMDALALKAGHHPDHPRASDWYLANLHREIPTYACYPNLAWQAVAVSDLAGGTYSNYTKYGEQRSGHGEMIGMQAELWGGTRWPEWGEPLKQTPDPKLGLLFLARGDVEHPAIWEEFEKNAGDGVRVLAHCKEKELENGAFLGGRMIREWHETSWADISLVRAMLSLLKEALEDETLTHFVFLSESCVPVKPWSEIRRRLKHDPRSMIPEQGAAKMREKHLERIGGVKDLPPHTMLVHPQWLLLNRDAARCVVENDFTEHFECIRAADEHYMGTVLALRGFDFDGQVKRASVTWVKWAEDALTAAPERQSDVTPALAGELADFKGFFARKFPKGSNIGEYGLHLG